MSILKRTRWVVFGAALTLVVAACGGDGATTTTAAGSTTATTAGSGPATTAAPAPSTTEEMAMTPIPDFCLEIVGADEVTADGTGINVGLTFDLLGRGDNSFNDAAGCGVDTAVFYTHVSFTEITPTDESARATDLQLQAENSQLVIGNGFSFEGGAAEACVNNPDVNFAITDTAMLDFSQDPPAPYCENARGMVFAEHEGSYLVGVAAALKSTTGKIGFIGGVSGIGLIERFEAGYIAGAKAVNPDIEVVSEYVTEFPDFAGFQSPDRGKEIALAMYDEGADVIYSAAGLTGSGTHLAAKEVSEASGSHVWSIGVDSDEYMTQDEAVRPYILTSMLKRVDTAVFNAIVDHINGEFTGGPVEYNLAAGGVGYSTSGGFVDDIADQIDAFAAKIISGEIVVPSDPADA